MEFFCSKDCPDACACDVEIVDGKIRFFPEKLEYLDIPFVCKKLRDFYEMESPEISSFLVDHGTRKECTTDEAIEKLSGLLGSTKGKNLLYLQGSGSLAMGMRCWDMLMSRVENCWFVDGDPCSVTGAAAHVEDFGNRTNPPIRNLEKVETIILFGRNAKAVNLHLFAYLKDLKKAGKRIVYIDPIRTATADLADHFIRIQPGADGLLSAAILSVLGMRDSSDLSVLLEKSGVSLEDVRLLADILPRPAGIVAGLGLQRYGNGKNSMQWINRLAVKTGNLDTFYYTRNNTNRFEKPVIKKERSVDLPDLPKLLHENKFDIILVVAANPVITYPEAGAWIEGMKNAFSVVVDTNLRETAMHADLFIRVGGMFAQEDSMGSYFFRKEANRGKILDAPSDFDIVRRTAEKMGLEIDFPDFGQIKPTLDEPVRVYKDRDIGLLFPEERPGMYRLLSGSHYRYLNSQVPEKYLALDNFLFIPPEIAGKENLSEGCRIRVYNDIGAFEAECRISDNLPKDTLMVYKGRKMLKGWPNLLTPSKKTDCGTGLAYYDTFVNVESVP